MTTIRFIDFIDILLVTILFFQTFKLLRGSNIGKIFIGMIIFIFVSYFIATIFEMQLIGTIVDKIINVGILALIIIFQTEIRAFLFNIGRRDSSSIPWIRNHFGENQKRSLTEDTVDQIVTACVNFQKTKTGALIVIERGMDLIVYEQLGEILNAKISSRLLESIFFKNSALHDGAVIISHGQITATSCILPVSRDQDIPKTLGLRHRSALGISEKVDAWAVVVSEETGNISLAKGGELLLNIRPETLKSFLLEA